MIFFFLILEAGYLTSKHQLLPNRRAVVGAAPTAPRARSPARVSGSTEGIWGSVELFWQWGEPACVPGMVGEDGEDSWLLGTGINTSPRGAAVSQPEGLKRAKKDAAERMF